MPTRYDDIWYCMFSCNLVWFAGSSSMSPSASSPRAMSYNLFGISTTVKQLIGYSYCRISVLSLLECSSQHEVFQWGRWGSLPATTILWGGLALYLASGTDLSELQLRDIAPVWLGSDLQIREHWDKGTDVSCCNIFFLLHHHPMRFHRGFYLDLS